MAKTTYVSEINGAKLAAERAEYTWAGDNIDSKFAEIEQEITSMGAFEVVPLTSGANPVPDVADPKTTVIYLTKESGSSKTDPYTEWIYIPKSTKPAVDAHWEIIGETSIDLSGYVKKSDTVGLLKNDGTVDTTTYKPVQTAVSDPTVPTTGTTTALAFIDSISQDAQGVITPTKKNITEATTSAGGLMSASDKTKLDALPTNAELEAALGDKKDVQTAVSDPSASGTSITFIDSISQDAQGVITPTKKTVANASASTSGVGGSAGLMTAADKEKLDGIESGAEANVQADWAQTSTGADDYIKNKPTALSDFSDDITEQTYIPTGEGSANPISGAAVASAMSSYKQVQTAVVDPTAHDTDKSIEFIDTISQDVQGVISPTKKAIREATTSQTGIVQLAGSIGATVASENNKAATEKAVRDAINALDVDAVTVGASKTLTSISEADGKISTSAVDIQISESQVTNLVDDLASKQDNLSFEGTYDASTNKVATESTVSDAIEALDVNAISVGADKTLSSISETDGKISATPVAIQIAESQVTNLTTDLAAKADKVTSATDGNFAGLDANGNLTDSGSKAADFATAAQGAKADSAVQGVTVAGTDVVNETTKIAAVPAAIVPTSEGTAGAYGVVSIGIALLDEIPSGT